MPLPFEKGRELAYLPAMAMPRPSRPSVVWADLKAVVLAPGRHKLLFAALAILMPVTVLLIFVLDPIRADYRQPDIIYVQNWPANRSEADVKAQQAIDLPKELEEKRLQEEAIKEHRRQLRKVADSLGIQVDK